tara:strand:- start:3301 stop:4074 length:774 start_codon:yes stop_codon:yes gene_type:complete
MNILSIDVGIKNLACCLLTLNNEKVNISDWDVINLNETIIKKCNVCNKTATYFNKKDNYCKIHSKKCEYYLPNEDIENINKKKINELESFISKYKLSYTLNNKKETLLNIKQFIDDRFLKLIKKEKSEYNFISIGRNLKNIFDDKFNKHKLDIVLIENQIGPLAIKMKTLQGMIAQYFIINSECEIFFVSSSNKLKEFSLKDEELCYKDRKNKSIEICEKLIDDEEKLNFFKCSKKKDDLADSYLQGLWYLKNKKLI